MKNLKLHHINYDPNMSLWDYFRQNQRPKVFSERIGLGKNCKTLKTWLWVFSAADNLKYLKLHHMDDNPNMSLWDEFSQNQRPKIFSEKIAIFPRRGPGKNCKTQKTWLWVLSATEKPEESETSPHRLRSQYESVFGEKLRFSLGAYLSRTSKP